MRHYPSSRPMAKPPWKPPAARDKKYPRISSLITEVVDGFRVTVWRVRSGALWDAALLVDELASAADEAIAIVKRYAAAEGIHTNEVDLRFELTTVLRTGSVQN
jgi:hypothetical protein